MQTSARHNRSGKRLVSTPLYLCYRLAWAWMRAAGGALHAAGVFGTLLMMALIIAFVGVFVFDAPPNYEALGILVPCAAFIGLVCLVVASLGKNMRRQYRNPPEVQPITASTLRELPAAESLVRSAAAPPEQQEATLVRPATTTAPEAPEQLLRARAGGHGLPS